jgi:hypothetical protein
MPDFRDPVASETSSAAWEPVQVRHGSRANQSIGWVVIVREPQ